ncbi:Bug family tripartite tricarboxylate transporter substrate binding protein [Muricoccus radiodurans]|uniref:Bug family tripartite tricarboxylate transporter substrate binding protein n=1 Tax=Muricoccus radiodurans TaxID=2231721 RepID=UPI003CF28A64
MMNENHVRRRGVLTGAAALLATPALAQRRWPERPVRFIFPFTAGSAVDVAIRIVASDLSERLGQQFVVDNRVGGAGNVGTEAAARSRPDGDTFLVGTPGNMAINPAMTRNLPYDAARDFVAVTHILSFPQVLVVSPDLPVRTLPELTAYTRERPGRLNYASSGIGSTNHLAMEMIRAATGLDAVHVPYRGGNLTVQAILSGDVQMCIEGIVSLPPLLADNKLRAIAVTTPVRAPMLPDVPAVAETVPGFDASAWIILFAPAGTPTPIQERLAEEVRTSLSRPAVRDRLVERGGTVLGNTPAEAAAFHTNELAKWRRAVDALGIAG